MTRAEEAALEAYNDMFHNPEKMSVRSTISPEEVAESNFDYKEPFKAFFLDVYQQGYSQAEKDLALTWEDVQLLDLYAMECQVEESKGRKFNSSQEFFEEVLRRFKAIKEEQK